MDRYAHLFPGQDEALAERLDSLWWVTEAKARVPNSQKGQCRRGDLRVAVKFGELVVPGVLGFPLHERPPQWLQPYTEAMEWLMGGVVLVALLVWLEARRRQLKDYAREDSTKKL